MTVNDIAATTAAESAAESAGQVNGERGPEDNPLHQTNNSFKWTSGQKQDDGDELVCNLCPELQKVIN